MKRNRSVLFEPLAGGGTLARPPGCFEPCACWPGKIYLDFKTNEKVGYQRFFFDTDERAHYLDGKRLTAEQAKKIDRASTPEYWIDPRYVGSDGLIRGAVSGYEWCDVCEPRKRAKLGRATFRFWITTLSNRRTYWFQFGPSAPPYMETAFIRFKELFRPTNDRQFREYSIFCLLCFGKYSSVPNCSERALARRFRLSRGRIRSIRLRFKRRLAEFAVRQKALTQT